MGIERRGGVIPWYVKEILLVLMPDINMKRDCSPYAQGKFEDCANKQRLHIIK
jgi:hypothetical protein